MPCNPSSASAWKDRRREDKRCLRSGHLAGDHLHLLIGKPVTVHDNPGGITREGRFGEGVHLLDADVHRLSDEVGEERFRGAGIATAVIVFFSRMQ
jgi:hypothetical protein